MLKALQAGPVVATAIRYARPLALLRPLDDAIGDGLTRPPPDHPPRSIV
jgi:CHASE2 domain-containing sensor protein